MVERVEKPSVDQYVRFYGSELPGPLSSGAELIALFREVFASVGDNLRKVLTPIVLELLAGVDTTAQWASESLHAEQLRQLFGQPQSIMAIPVAVELTRAAEHALMETRASAATAASAFQTLKEKLRLLVSVQLSEMLTKLQQQLAEVELAEAQLLMNQDSAGTQSQIDRVVGLRQINEHKCRLLTLIAAGERELTEWFHGQVVGAVARVEGVIYQARSHSVDLPPLDTARAIPANI